MGLAACLQLLLGARPVCLPSSPPAPTPLICPLGRSLLMFCSCYLCILLSLHFTWPSLVLPHPPALPWFPLHFTRGMGHVRNLVCIISATGFVGLLL